MFQSFLEYKWLEHYLRFMFRFFLSHYRSTRDSDGGVGRGVLSSAGRSKDVRASLPCPWAT